MTASGHTLSLEPLSLPDVDARRLVDIAAQTGFERVGMVLHSPAESLPADPIVTDAALRRETLARMHETGVALHNVECFNLTKHFDLDACEAALRCGQELGARAASAIVWENDDRADVLASLRGLADLAARYCLRINLEFLALCRSLRTVQDAADLVRDAGRDNVGIMVDLLHLVRSGGTVGSVAALDPALIGGAQICDGPLRIDDEGQLLAEAGGNRAPPGEGGFPVAAFVRALPPGLVVGVEVPQVALIGQVAPQLRARRLMEASRYALMVAA